MAQDKFKIIHLIYRCFLSVLIVTLGILLIVSCIDIWQSGKQPPYSPEAITSRFTQISLIVYGTLTTIIGGIALDCISPYQKQLAKFSSNTTQLAQLRSKALATQELDNALVKQCIRRFKSKYICINLIACCLFVILLLHPLYYFRNTSHFSTENLNADIMKGISRILLPSVLGFFLFSGAALICRHIIRQEIKLWRQLTEGTIPSVKTPSKQNDFSRGIWCIRSIILLLAIILIVAGCINGGARDVLKKAVAICTECIGLG